MSVKQLGEKFYAEMNRLEKRFPNRTALLIPALHAAQEEKGWLPDPVMDEIAEFLEIHPAQVREVASFYVMFNRKPVGTYHVKVCTNASCMLRGADRVMKLCEKKLGVKCGCTTEDKRFTLDEEECLGSCGTAPVVMVNDEIHEGMNEKQLQVLFEKLESK